MGHLGPDNAFWCDGEWIEWDEIIDPDDVDRSVLRRLEREANMRQRYPKADIQLVPYFHNLLLMARSYYETTGRHLAVYGDIGELFGAVVYGITLHKPYAQGADGRLGNDFVEVKTISPLSRAERITLKLENRNFSKVLVVRINGDFEVSGKLVERAALVGSARKTVTRTWDAIDAPAVRLD